MSRAAAARWPTTSRVRRALGLQARAAREAAGPVPRLPRRRAARRRSRPSSRWRWATLPAAAAARTGGRYRLSAVRGFAALPAHARPGASRCRRPTCCPTGRVAPTPYLYSDAEIAALMAASRACCEPRCERRPTSTLIGLLAVTGMRVGEAIRLDRADIDLEHATADRAATASSASPASCRCTPAPSTRCAATCAAATGRASRADTRRCSSPAPAPGCSTATSSTRSPDSLDRAGLSPRSASCRPSAARPAPHASPSAALLDAYRAGDDVHARLPLLSTYLGHVHPGSHLLVSAAPRPSCWPSPAQRLEHAPAGRRAMSALAPTLQAFFTDRLIRQRHASPHTIAAYRDTLRLLLGFAPTRPGKQPSRLDIADLDAPLIGAFLDHLEHDRGNSDPHPQRPPGRDPLAVPLRRAAPPRARRDDPTRPGDPAQTLRPRAGHLPHRTRDRRPARRPRPRHLDRAPRPRPAAARRPDRAARLRADRPRPARDVAPRRRRARQLPRQRPQGPHHPADHADRRRPARLAHRARRQPDDPLFPTRTGRTRSAATRSSTASPNTPRTATQPARRWRRRRSRRTSCGTPPRCGCCTPASTPP